jgi:hypothetical protein
VHRLLAAKLAELPELNLALHKLLVFAGVVVKPLALRALQLDDIFRVF